MRFVLIAILLLMTANPALAQGGFGGHGYGWATNRSGGGGGLTSPVGIADGGTGQTSKAAAFNALSPLTTLGDLLYGGASGAGTRLAGNTSTTRKYLGQTGTGSASQAPTFTQPNFNELLGACDLLTQVTNALPVANGGTGLASYTAGDTLYASGSTTLSKLAKGTAGQLYQMNAGATAPVWNSMSGDVTINSSGVAAIKSNVALAGNPTTTTQSANDNSTKIATTAYVDRKPDYPFPLLTTSPIYKVVTAQVGNSAPADPGVAFTGAINVNNTSTGTVTKVASSNGHYFNYASAASVGSFGGLVSSGNEIAQFRSLPILIFQIMTGANAADIQNCRIWVGASGTDQHSNATPGNSSIFFGYDPAIDANVNWYLVTSNGTTTTRTDSTIPIANNTQYTLGIDASSGSSVTFYINGVAVGTLSTNLPTSSTGFNIYIQNTSINGVAKNIQWKSYQMRCL